MDKLNYDTAPLCGAQTDFENHIAQNRKKSLAFALRLTRGNQSESEDLLQEATVRAWGAFTRFKQESNFQTWFLQILTNVFLDYIKRRTRTECSLDAFSEDANPALMTTGDNPDALILAQARVLEIQKALADLPAHLRAVIQLVDFDDLSCAEAAETLNIAAGTVRSRRYRANRILRRALAHLMPADSE